MRKTNGAISNGYGSDYLLSCFLSSTLLYDVVEDPDPGLTPIRYFF